MAGLVAGREVAGAALAVVDGGRDILSGGLGLEALANQVASLAIEGAIRGESAVAGGDGGARGLSWALGGGVAGLGAARMSGGRHGGVGSGGRDLGSTGSSFGMAGGGLDALGRPGSGSGALGRTVGALRSTSLESGFLAGGLLGGSENWRRGGSFNLQLAEADEPGGPGWSLWGRYGLGGSFSPAVDADGFAIDGDVSSAIAGADLRVGSVTMGVAVSRAAGEIGIDNRLLGRDLMDASLTTVLPYVNWSPAAGKDLWAMGGYGWGEAGLREMGPGVSDLGMRMGALGGRTDLVQLGAASLGLRADALAALMGTEATAQLGEVTADVTQARLALTLGTAFGSAVRLEPQVDIGARMDGGDAETGAGIEVGGSLGLVGGDGAVRLNGSGRWLVAHQVEGFEDWGASVSLAIGSPQAGSEGFGLTLEPEWGGSGRRMRDLWTSRDGVGLGDVRGRAFAGPGAGPAGVAGTLRPDRMRLNLGYGISLADGAGSLAPFAGVHVDGGAHEMRVGAKVRIAGSAAPRTRRRFRDRPGRPRACAARRPGVARGRRGRLFGGSGPARATRCRRAHSPWRRSPSSEWRPPEAPSPDWELSSLCRLARRWDRFCRTRCPYASSGSKST